MPQSMFERVGTEADLYQKVLFILNGGGVKRFHVIPTIKEITVSSHQHGVAWMAYLITEGNISVNLIMACLAHDLPEQVGGDMPSPAKRMLGVDVQHNKLEDRLLRENDCTFHLELSAWDVRVLKWADIFQGMLECVSERALGNQHAKLPFKRWQSYLKTNPPVDQAENVYKVILTLWEEAIGN